MGLDYEHKTNNINLLAESQASCKQSSARTEGREMLYAEACDSRGRALLLCTQ